MTEPNMDEIREAPLAGGQRLGALTDGWSGWPDEETPTTVIFRLLDRMPNDPQNRRRSRFMSGGPFSAVEAIAIVDALNAAPQLLARLELLEQVAKDARALVGRPLGVGTSRYEDVLRKSLDAAVKS